jgi:hypothetical protein
MPSNAGLTPGVPALPIGRSLQELLSAERAASTLAMQLARKASGFRYSLLRCRARFSTGASRLSATTNKAPSCRLAYGRSVPYSYEPWLSHPSATNPI